MITFKQYMYIQYLNKYKKFLVFAFWHSVHQLYQDI